MLHLYGMSWRPPWGRRYRHLLRIWRKEKKERGGGVKKKEEKEILLYTLSARTARAAFDVHARPEQHNNIHQSTGGAAFKTHSARRQSSKKETMNRFNTLEMKNNHRTMYIYSNTAIVKETACFIELILRTFVVCLCVRKEDGVICVRSKYKLL